MVKNRRLRTRASVSGRRRARVLGLSGLLGRVRASTGFLSTAAARSADDGERCSSEQRAASGPHSSQRPMASESPEWPKIEPITSGGTKPPRPPAAPTMPVTEPTLAAGRRWATRANVAPAAARGHRPWTGTRSCRRVRAPASSTGSRHRRRPRRRRPSAPIGPDPVREPAADRSHQDGDDHEAGHPVRRVRRGEAVGVLQVGGQVDAEGDVAAEADRVERRRPAR